MLAHLEAIAEVFSLIAAATSLQSACSCQQ
jgi:hypothetical protein